MSSFVPFWFIVIAILWTGFFILEGFDFGVGMLHSVIGRDEAGRRAAINTIGPLWDGNEVWLIVAGAAMFAAFPGWYATMFAGMYLAMALLLGALIIRGVSFEYRGKRDAARWRRTWDVLLTAGSFLAPLLFPDVWEYPAVLVLACLARPTVVRRKDERPWPVWLGAGLVWVAPL